MADYIVHLQDRAMPGTTLHRATFLYAVAKAIAQDERFAFADRQWAEAVADGADRMVDRMVAEDA